MGGVVDAGQMLKVEVRIYLRAADVGMAQQFLHAAQITARFEQVSRKRMTEHMRVHVHWEALASRPSAHPQLYRSDRQLPAGSTHEQGTCLRGGALPRNGRCLLEQPGPLHQPLLQRADGMAANGHN